MRVLVVEDEAALREELKHKLTDSGFGVDAVADGDEGLFAGLNYAIDAAVVDVGLPTRSGLDVIREWRLRKRTFPVVVLTARTGWRNRVEGLEAGADDYVDKPFSFAELLARLRGIIRRTHGWAAPEMSCGPFKLNTNIQRVTVNDTPLDLTTYEFRLLEFLMLRAGQVLPGAELAEHMYQEDQERESNIVAQLVCRLRRKLDPHDEIRPIETVYGGGYRWIVPRS